MLIINICSTYKNIYGNIYNYFGNDKNTFLIILLIFNNCGIINGYLKVQI